MGDGLQLGATFYDTHDETIERALLALLLYQPHLLEHVPVAFSPDVFAVQDHPEIFAVIQEKAALGSGSIHPEVEVALPHLAGQDGYLCQLRRAFMDATPDGVASYCRALTDLWRRRQLVELAERIKLKAYLGEHAASTQGMVLEAMEAIEAISTQSGVTGRAAVRAGDIANTVLEMADRAMRGEFPDLISTGLPSLDKALGGGIKPADFVLIGGRTGMGKSALGFNIAAAAALRGEPTAIYSPEMTENDVMRRIMSNMASIPYAKIRGGALSQKEFDRLAEAKMRLAVAPLFIEAQGGLSLAQLSIRLRNFGRAAPLRMVVIDGLGLVKAPPHVERHGPTARVEHVSMGLKQLAKDLRCTVVGMSQLSREPDKREDNRPSLSDLRQSGSLEQDADCVLLLYREGYYLENTNLTRGRYEKQSDWAERYSAHEARKQAASGKGEVIIAKLRDGRPGSVYLDWRPEYTAYREAHRGSPLRGGDEQ